MIPITFNILKNEGEKNSNREVEHLNLRWYNSSQFTGNKSIIRESSRSIFKNISFTRP